jgi:hypothetical protein
MHTPPTGILKYFSINVEIHSGSTHNRGFIEVLALSIFELVVVTGIDGYGFVWVNPAHLPKFFISILFNKVFLHIADLE